MSTSKKLHYFPWHGSLVGAYLDDERHWQTGNDELRAALEHHAGAKGRKDAAAQVRAAVDRLNGTTEPDASPAPPPNPDESAAPSPKRRPKPEGE